VFAYAPTNLNATSQGVPQSIHTNQSPSEKAYAAGRMQHELLRLELMKPCQTAEGLIQGVSAENKGLICCIEHTQPFQCVQWDADASVPSMSNLPCERLNDDYCGKHPCPCSFYLRCLLEGTPVLSHLCASSCGSGCDSTSQHTSFIRWFCLLVSCLTLFEMSSNLMENLGLAI
jgi:hypothetical protein